MTDIIVRSTGPNICPSLCLYPRRGTSCCNHGNLQENTATSQLTTHDRAGTSLPTPPPQLHSLQVQQHCMTHQANIRGGESHTAARSSVFPFTRMYINTAWDSHLSLMGVCSDQIFNFFTLNSYYSYFYISAKHTARRRSNTNTSCHQSWRKPIPTEKCCRCWAHIWEQLHLQCTVPATDHTHTLTYSTYLCLFSCL